MSMSTILQLPLIVDNQSLKHITHNEALQVLDALVQLCVVDRDLSFAPASPSEGERFIVATGATGDWAGNDNNIAAWQNSAWVYYPPNQGWLVWVADENALLAWDGAAWIASATSSPMVGVNALADLTNRLAVSSPATLFNHEGNGHQLKINKNLATDTASFIYQTGFSGRTEMGLTGDDDFHFKVSPDGSTWNEALVLDKDTGDIEVKQNASYAGFLDVSEISVPANPLADTARLYAKDVGGATKLAMRDSAGTETVLGSGGGAAAFRGVLVKMTTTQSIPNSIHTQIDWGVESYDTDAIWAATPNPSRLTVPAGVTKIRISANVAWSSNASGDRYFLLYKNGAIVTEYALYGRDNPNSSGIYAQPGISPVISVTGGDYFELDLYQTSGASLDIGSHAGTWAAMEIIE